MEKQEEEVATAVEADYRQIVESAELFLDKLRDFHSSFATNFTSLSVGGTGLDLHRLFVEVTSRGGLDQVIRDRKWEEVISSFKFGITNVRQSFLLRKYYLSLLYRFEQAYFFRNKESAVAINDATNQIPVIGSTVQSTSNLFEESMIGSHLQASVQIQPGVSLVGVIDEKFDNGYVVSVNVGSNKLKGILYHLPDGPQPYWSPNPCIPQSRKRKKSQLPLLDPSKLKQTRSSYNFFTDQYDTLKPVPETRKVL